MDSLKLALGKSQGEGRRLWRTGFTHHIILNEETYQRKLVQMRENPMRAGLIPKGETWGFQGSLLPIDRA